MADTALVFNEFMGKFKPYRRLLPGTYVKVQV